MIIRVCCGFAVALLLMSAAQVGAAQDRHSISATLVYQSPAALENGGEITATRSHIQTEGRLFKSDKLFANWSLGLGGTDYDFKGTAHQAWGEIYHGSLSVSLLRPLNRQWTLLVSPSINARGEADAEASKTLSYGLFTALNWQGGESLRLGIGVAGYENLEEQQLFPVIIVDWQPSRKWRLANPLRAGVTGPAGLEISWNAAEKWTLAAGGATRSYRFRLAPENSIRDGIGEEEIVPVWLRMSRQLQQGQMTLYAGATLEGSLKIEDRHGNTLERRDYDDTPFVALYFSGSF